MHTALKSWHKNISYGGIAQLARARGSYPRCRWFKSSSRYYKKESLCGASFCVISILSFMKTLNIICHSGSRSQRAAELFEKNGFFNVAVVDGGLVEAEREGLRIVRH